MNEQLVIDSSAWVEYLDGTQTGSSVARYIDDPSNTLWITGLIVAEVCARALRVGKRAQDAFAVMERLGRVLPIDLQIGFTTATIYHDRRKTHGKFGLADAHVVAASNRIKARILTCDTDFEGIRNAVVLKH